jgi:hypothetical protein
MSIIDIPLDSVPFEDLGDHISRLKEYLRNATNPNEVASNGETCVSIALIFFKSEADVAILQSLLARGGNPNLPTPIRNFLRYMNAATTVAPLQYMIDAGLELNRVYTAEADFLSTGHHPFTMLDYAMDVRACLNKNRKPLSALAHKYAGTGLGARRRFVDDTISLLESHGAQHAPEQKPV